MESLDFLTENKDGNIKGRTCANESTKRDYMRREEIASNTAITESMFITGVIEAKQKIGVMTSDVPNEFVQTYQKMKKES